MNRTHRSFALVAFLLATLMPIEQAHCLWMRWESRAVSSAGFSPVAPVAPGHECCARARSRSLPVMNGCGPSAPRLGGEARPVPIPAACACVQLPPGSLPPVTVIERSVTSHTIATIPCVSAAMPIARLETPIPALDVGSSPLPIDLGAHGLRAPPLSA